MGGAIILSPIHSRADPYMLPYSLVHSNQSCNKGSRSIKRPLVVDLVDHTLTLPSQVIGYTLTLESEEGEVYTYMIMSTVFTIPSDLVGNLKVTISDGNSCYRGNLQIE